MNPIILALDASSTSIGYCLYDGAVLAHGEIALKHADIAERCRLAYAQFNGLIELYGFHGIDCVALEAPVARFAKSLIPQVRVSGALMAAASLVGLMVVEVTPTQAKAALTGCGTANKAAMQLLALHRFGVTGEHASDAVGVALAACGLVSVERQAA